MGFFAYILQKRPKIKSGEKQTGNEAVVIGIDFFNVSICHFIQRKGERKSG